MALSIVKLSTNIIHHVIVFFQYFILWNSRQYCSSGPK